jgi:hypothetical protein
MPAGAALSLRFERDNPCNTTIVDPDGNRSYTVATDFPKPDKPVTRLHDGIGNLIAEWTWRDARSDLLTIRDRPETPASAWLKKSIIPFREYVKTFSFILFLPSPHTFFHNLLSVDLPRQIPQAN